MKTIMFVLFALLLWGCGSSIPKENKQAAHRAMDDQYWRDHWKKIWEENYK